jgi:hypothetical protein
VAQDLIFTLGYIGQAAQDLHSGFLSNINNLSPKYFSLGDKLSIPGYTLPLGGSSNGVNAPYSTFTGALGQALRPFPQYDYIAGDCCLENLGHSSYDALVTSLERRFHDGLNLQASYTWSIQLHYRQRWQRPAAGRRHRGPASGKGGERAEHHEPVLAELPLPVALWQGP